MYCGWVAKINFLFRFALFRFASLRLLPFFTLLLSCYNNNKITNNNHNNKSIMFFIIISFKIR